MTARCLLWVWLLCVPCFGLERNAAKIKAERAAMEKELFPLLQEADEVVLYSLYPMAKEHLAGEPDDTELTVAFRVGQHEGPAEPSEVDKKVAALARKAELFEGYPILGKVAVKDAKEIGKVLSQIRAEMLTDEEDLGGEADCFDPRHGILVSKGDRRIIFLICFSCSNSLLKGVPENAKGGQEAFKDFRKDFADFLNARFKAAKVVHPPYKDNPPKEGK